MKDQHWIDALFRAKLEQRSFPAGDEELERMHSLLASRNTSRSKNIGGPLFWWLSACVPLALMAWWAMWGGASLRNAPLHTAAVPDGVVSTRAQAVPGNAGMKEGEGSSAGTSVSEQAEVSQGPSSAGSFGKPAAEGNAYTLHGPAVADLGAARTWRTIGADAPTSAELMVAPEELNSEDQSNVELTSGRVADLLAIRKVEVPVATERLLEYARETTVRRASGELQLFASPAQVRVQGEPATVPFRSNATIFGLEYRVRRNALSFATGVHYAGYALRTEGEGAGVDTKVDQVEIPVLLGAGVRCGRWSASLQSGPAVELLFNAAGRYPLGADRSDPGFPDEAFSAVNLSWAFRPQLSYLLNEKLTVDAGYLWKTQLSGMANAGLLRDARMLSTGIVVGLTWRLERNTF